VLQEKNLVDLFFNPSSLTVVEVVEMMLKEDQFTNRLHEDRLQVNLKWNNLMLALKPQGRISD
jgi:hypothetical protein